MHLTELIDQLRGEQTKRGNVPLSRVHVMHENTVLIAHNDEVPDPPAKQKIDITGMGEDQIDELRAEFSDAELFVRPQSKEEVEAAAARQAAHQEHAALIPEALPTEVADLEGKGKEIRMPCPVWDGKGHACVLPFGHEGDHVFEVTTIGPVNTSDDGASHGTETVTIPIPDTPKE